MFLCLHPTAAWHLEILAEVAEQFLLVADGGVTRHPDFAALTGQARFRSYLGAEMTRAADALCGSRPYPVESAFAIRPGFDHKGARSSAGRFRHPATIKEGASLVAYSNTQLFIDGKWRPSQSGRTIPVINPATEEVIGTVAHAESADLDAALAAADKGFKAWRKVSPFDRYKIMRKAAELIRQRVDEIAPIMTMEQGKPLTEAKVETLAAADIIEWFAEEGRRTYGRIVPARGPGVYQLVIKEPVGPVAAFTPWNFPINQVVRKLGRGARGRLLDHRQGAGRHAGLARRS